MAREIYDNGVPPDGHGRRDRPNLLLLTIDSWRADFMTSVSGIPLTPSLHSLAHHTLQFRQAYSTGSWTSPGLVSILTGEDALSHGVWYPWSRPRRGRPTLPARLRAAGYHVADTCYLPAIRNFHHLGYDPARAPTPPPGPAGDFLPQAVEAFARQGRRPWFAWYHYKDVHLPYWPAPEYRRLFALTDDRLPRHVFDSICTASMVPRGTVTFEAEDVGPIRRLYAASVRSMDDFLGRVLASLERSGQWPHTTVVITADHGDELLEHGHVGHASTARHATLYDEVLRVPLVVMDARICRPRLCHDPVQLQDLMPTLLSWAGVTPPPLAHATDLSGLLRQASEGRADEPVALPQGAGGLRTLRFHSSRMGYQTPRHCEGQAVVGFRDDTRKYIVERYGAERRLLFDLVRDPAELYPLTSGPRVDAADAHLHALCPDLDDWFVSAQSQRPMPQRIRHALRQLTRAVTRGHDADGAST